MEFEKFPKIPRYKRDIVITEKLDGTNAQVAIDECWPGDWVGIDCNLRIVQQAGRWYNVYAGSRNRWLTTENDNYGFAKWVQAHAEQLVEGLGEGRHYGEWWGQGIQRRYGLNEKRFSLFNTGEHNDSVMDLSLELLGAWGSQAAPGFMNPEGIVVYHTAGRNLYKVTLDGDAAKGE